MAERRRGNKRWRRCRLRTPLAAEDDRQLFVQIINHWWARGPVVGAAILIVVDIIGQPWGERRGVNGDQMGN
ncbi:MAG: hypothetical protein AOY29_09015 [Alcanivorax borkumensis]|nr:MAG: hypothetical protein AOY29_09015 [Alcanivorax borkumensis]